MEMRFEVVRFGQSENRRAEIKNLVRGMNRTKRQDFLESFQEELEDRFGMDIEEIAAIAY